MPGKPILAFDCDGILSDLVPGMSKMCQIISGRKCAPADWVDYDHFTNLGVSHDQYLEGLVSHRVLENAEVHDGAAESILRAKNLGWEIALITARAFHPQAEAVTRKWLVGNGIHVDHLIFVGPSESKLHALSSLPNVVAYVDDYLRHIETLTESGISIPLFLMDQPWNKGVDKYTRVFSVHEFVDRAIAAHNSPTF